MSKQKRKRTSFTIDQRRDYAKLMVEEGYTVKQIIEISGASQTAVGRWKRQYIQELEGKTPEGKAMTAEQQEIQRLRKELWRAKRDNEILKKAAAIFIAED
jgi:transposase